MPIRVKKESYLFAEPKAHYVLQTEKGLKTNAVALNLGEMALVVHGVIKRFRVEEGLPSQGTSVLVQVGEEEDGEEQSIYQEFARVATAANPEEDVPSYEDLEEWNFCVPAGIKYEITTDPDGAQWIEVKDCQYFKDPCEVDDNGVMHPLQ